MGAITRRNAAAEQQLLQALTSSLGNMELATRVTKVALRELDGIYTYSVQEAAVTLQTADDVIMAARHANLVTPEMETALTQHTEAYLTDMLQMTHAAGERLATILLSR